MLWRSTSRTFFARICLILTLKPEVSLFINIKNFRRDSHGHHGSKCCKLAQHAHSHGSHTCTHTLTIHQHSELPPRGAKRQLSYYLLAFSACLVCLCFRNPPNWHEVQDLYCAYLIIAHACTRGGGGGGGACWLFLKSWTLFNFKLTEGNTNNLKQNIKTHNRLKRTPLVCFDLKETPHCSGHKKGKQHHFSIGLTNKL